MQGPHMICIPAPVARHLAGKTHQVYMDRRPMVWRPEPSMWVRNPIGRVIETLEFSLQHPIRAARPLPAPTRPWRARPAIDACSRFHHLHPGENPLGNGASKRWGEQNEADAVGDEAGREQQRPGHRQQQSLHHLPGRVRVESPWIRSRVMPITAVIITRAMVGQAPM